MEITGKVHLFFEQSGTFKKEFQKLGYMAEDYDIQDNFGETDHQVDLFKEIEKAYTDNVSVFDQIGGGDLVMAFFPCIYFCDAKTLIFRGDNIFQKNWDLHTLMNYNIDGARKRQYFFEMLMMMCAVCSKRNIKMIIENPWNKNGESFLQHNFIKPSFVDSNRLLRGDHFSKPTAYWFINCSPTHGLSIQKDKKQKTITGAKRSDKAGLCSEERSMISPDYARNFICDFIIGKTQKHTMLDLFN